MTKKNHKGTGKFWESYIGANHVLLLTACSGLLQNKPTITEKEGQQNNADTC